MKYILLISFLIPFVAGAQVTIKGAKGVTKKYNTTNIEYAEEVCIGCEEDSLHDRRFYDTLGKQFMINYTYFAFGKLDSGHVHFPASIEIIEYYANRQKVVWVGRGLYSETQCASDNPSLWIRRYLNKKK